MRGKIIPILMCFIMIFSMVSAKKSVDEDQVNSAINDAIEKLNSDQKYLQFIEDSQYHSCKLIIEDKEYYFMYDGEKVVRNGSSADFEVSLKYKKFKKIVENYNKGNYKMAVMNAYNKVPKEVRNNLFNQCMKTAWCKNGDF